jgi:hypothetical protein
VRHGLPLGKQGGNGLRAAAGRDVPGEGDEIAPMAFRGKEFFESRCVCRGQGCVHARQPAFDRHARVERCGLLRGVR